MSSFSEALVAIKRGARVARKGWNGKGMYLYLQEGSSFEPPEARNPHMFIASDGLIHYRAHIDMKTAQGDHVPWLASQSDLLEEDWFEVVV